MTDAPTTRSRRIGYRRPPASTRFRKGQSGNPRGRPRGRRNEPPYEAVLGQMVTIREDGVERRVTAAEAFLLHMTKQGLEGDGAAARAAMAAIEEARASRLAREPDGVRIITQGHRPARERQRRARAAAHGPEARPLPRDGANGARALDRRGRPRPAGRSAADARRAAGRSSARPGRRGRCDGRIGGRSGDEMVTARPRAERAKLSTDVNTRAAQYQAEDLPCQ